MSVGPDEAEAAPDDLDSYYRFREVAIALIPPDERPSKDERGLLRRILDGFPARSTQRRSLQADYISLIAPLRRPQHLAYAPAALAGILSLRSGNLDQAQEIFEELRARVLRPSPLFYLWRGSLISVLIWLLIFLAIILLGFDPHRPLILTDFGSKVLASFTAGCMGAFVSMMQRLDHFVSLVDRPRDYLTWTGFALPVVGGTLGAFAAILLFSNIVNISIGRSGDTQSASILLYVIIAFIAGYSERFSKSLIKLAEEQLGASERARRDEEKPR